MPVVVIHASDRIIESIESNNVSKKKIPATPFKHKDFPRVVELPGVPRVGEEICVGNIPYIMDLVVTKVRWTAFSDDLREETYNEVFVVVDYIGDCYGYRTKDEWEKINNGINY